MKLSVIGTGYVGLVAGACFASRGNHVTCVDVDESKIAELARGCVPIYEPGLEEIVRESLATGHLRFTSDVQLAVRESDVVFIAVGTPPGQNGSTDLRAVFAVADQIAACIEQPTTIVIKSTVPVGTADAVRERIDALAPHPCIVLNNPEFLREGRAVEDFLFPDRVVIGTPNAAEEAHGLVALYSSFAAEDRIMVVDSRSAELSKYASNAFLATKLSFMNEMAELAESAGADIELVRKVMGADARIGPGHLAPGLGYGGSCFPKDISSLLYTGTTNKVPLRVLNGVQQANAAQPQRMFDKLSSYFEGDLRGRRIALWGIAFKPDTDDIREAPALVLLNLLNRAGASVVAYDPSAAERAKAVTNGNIAYAIDPYDCVTDADALLLATEWDAFRGPDWPRLRSLMRGRAIFDGRNVYAPEVVANQGFDYYSVGRPDALARSKQQALSRA